MPYKSKHRVSPGRYQIHMDGHTNGNANTIAAATIVNAPTMSDPLQQVLERRGYLDKQEGNSDKRLQVLRFSLKLMQRCICIQDPPCFLSSKIGTQAREPWSH
jgi:DNA-binding MarR family transcriptional regulator